ncbi:MAG TPA: BrnT family toxin [Rhizomicrobium sp.]|nr:BrnT family toxin [Rhizomicrobium sp.]
MDFAGFDWDAGNREKCSKHGVTTEAIEQLFLRGLIVLPDEVHSQDEQRFRAIGRMADGRGVFVVFALRQRGTGKLVRPISARYMHEKELKRYEENYEAEEAPGLRKR